MDVASDKTQGASISIEAGDPGRLVFRLEGRLDDRHTPDLWDTVLGALRRHDPKHVRVEAEQVTYCDGCGLALLFEIKLWASERHCRVEIQGLGPHFMKLLKYFRPDEFASSRVHPHRRVNVAEEVGRTAHHIWQDFRLQVAFVGEVFSAVLQALLRPWRVRWKDMFLVAERAGADAVGIVAMLGFLFGLIITFSSAMPLREFAVEVYVSDLAALAMVRVLGPFITTIILAGRSGSAFAAEIGTMKINNEVDALITMGFDPVRFLVVPRVIAGTLVTPLLAIIANLAGLVGSAVVMLSLGFTLHTYTSHVQSSIGADDIFSGLFKCFVFGALVAGVGCLRGLQTETGASAVGISATRAVVSGIVLVVVAEGAFAVLYHYMGI